MPDDLARFQEDFLAALDGREFGRWVRPGASSDGLWVYRNTVARGAVEAVVANFPSVARLTGEDWLAAAAAQFVRAYPPRRPALIAYGAEFPAWLADFPPARTLPYLAGVARLDRLWMECHLAADAEPLDAAALAALPLEALTGAVARLHPSVRYAWFDSNVPTLWRAQRSEAEPERLAWRPEPEGLLLARPSGAVVHLPIGPGLHAFVAGCDAGRSLAAAAAGALEAEPALNLPALLGSLLGAGALATLEKTGP